MVSIATTAEPVAEEMHDEHSVSSVTFQTLVISLGLSEIAIGTTVWAGSLWLTVPLVLLAAHLMHGLLIGFHEASHGLLRKSRRLNEFDGVLIGIFSFLPFSLYRVVHQMHHMHLATEKDTELWPFVLTKAPRWVRRLAAFFELTLGLFYSPLIFLRVFVHPHSLVRSRKVRRRIWLELALSFVVWAAILAAVVFFGVWKYFVWLYLVPALIAANLQTWRKYVEHLGLTGNTVNSSTRSIVPKSWLGHVFAYTLLHEPYHGVHHQNAGLPHRVLPLFTSVLAPKYPGERPPFVSYRQALPDVIRSLGDPRVGAQWRNSSPNGQPTS
ncbi:MAG: fatty acid desaturase family protein [Chthoniobacterales bacterium]